jgi:carboxypeptidase family protein
MRGTSAWNLHGVLVAPLAAVLLLIAAACGQVAQPGATGTIEGVVTAGPICPVQSAEDPCPPKPVTDREVDIQTHTGARVVSAETDAAGRYRVAVPPGSYVVQVQIVQGAVGIHQTTPGDVTVVANQTVTLNIELDTGIR